MLGPILAATVAVADLKAAAAAYGDLLGYEVLAGGEPRPWALVGPAGADAGVIRLREVPGVVTPPPYRTYGWSAIEILVADIDMVHERCLAHPAFQVFQPPGRVGGHSALRALQATGPGGEGLYVTQISGPVAGFEMPSVETWENRVMAVVAASRSLDETRDFFELGFNLRCVTDHGLPVRVLNQAFGLPAGTLHRISSLQLAGSSVLETDQYPDAAQARQEPRGGVVSATFAMRREGRPLPPGLEPLPPNGQPPYLGRPAWAGTAPGGFEFELVEV
jgi:catechol 2,3-dioxygenase-like lactoylglutathione lyase family enzyme